MSHSPTISVVITCYNYAHFLAPCMDSVLDQTLPAHEVIVVDDGSTDGSPDVLTTYAQRAKIIRTENQGQAGAFNTGFAASTGDLVMFLDADDILAAHALETIATHWRPGLGHISFGLETVDEAGNSIGVHPGSIIPCEGDNRPRLLATGTFDFPPTSGNVFAREMLEAALPMPTKRWRISADCFLIRASAIYGPTGFIPHILGSYRIHSANNYARTEPGRRDAGLHISNQRDIADALDDLSRVERLLQSDEALRAALTDRAMRIRSIVDSAVAPVANADIDDSVFDARTRPIVELDRWYDLDQPSHEQRSWRRFLPPERQSRTATMTVRLPPTRGALAVQLGFEGAKDAPIQLFVDGELVAECPTYQREIVFSLPRDPWARDREVQLVAHATRSFATAPVFRSILISEGEPGTHFPLVPDGQTISMTDLARGMKPDQWEPNPDGSVEMLTDTGRIRLSGPRGGMGTLTLGVGDHHPRGRLTILAWDVPVFAGTLGVGSQIRVPLTFAEDGSTELLFDYTPDEPTTHLRLETVSLDMRQLQERSGKPPLLSLGETLHFALHQRSTAAVGDGWALVDGIPQASAIMSTIKFRVPPNTQNHFITLHVEPVISPPPDQKHLFGVSDGDALCASSEVLGPGAVEFAVHDVSADGIVELAFHSVFVTADPDEDPVFAPFNLLSIELAGQECAHTRRPVARSNRPLFSDILNECDRILAHNAPDPEALLGLRERLVGILLASNDSLPILLAGSVRTLETLIAVGQLLERAPRVAEHSDDRLRATLIAILNGPAYRVPELVDFTTLPAPLLATCETFAAWLGAAPLLETDAEHADYRAYLNTLLANIHVGLNDLHSPLYPLAEAALRSLRSVGAIFGGDDVRDLVSTQSRAVERLLAHQGAPLFAARPKRSRDKLRVGVMLRDVVPSPEGWALLGSYEHLDRSRFEPVLIRMDQSDATMPTGEMFASTLPLDGLSVAEAVAAIRSLDLDIFVSGCYVMGWERASAIMAHRLAPLQIWHTSVCPTTSGLSAFDTALTCLASEPDTPEPTYSEPLSLLAGERQCAYAFGPTPSNSDTRKELGIAEQTQMITSGAMAHKVTDTLLKHWASILTAVPNAHLVLYPFAPNWSMAFAEQQFRARCDAAGMPTSQLTTLPTIPHDRVRQIVGAADLYLDSFPYTGATTVCEALSQGTPVVTLAGNALRQMTGPSWVRAYGLDELVAQSAQDYVDTAVRLLSSPDDLQVVAERCTAAAISNPPPHDDRAGVGQTLSNALWQAAEASGLFELAPQPAHPAPPLIIHHNQHARKFAIFASPRTGSTLLCSILNRTPGILCHFELFHRDMIQFSHKTIRDADAIAARDADPVTFFQEVFSQPGEHHMVGFKHFWHLDPEVTHTILDDEDIQVIYLSRENLMAQYSSEMIARASGKWVTPIGQAREEFRVEFDQEDFERFERYQRNMERDRLSLLAERGRNAFFVEYQSLLDPRLLARLSDFLGHKIPMDVKPDLVRQNRVHIPDRFTNSRDVIDYLAERKLSKWEQA